ncbi:MAG: hypothetical protein EBS59_06625 [Verrucomicrobia bacterium]|nr:hypothetical protein [Verrucomicrobiota bacterium]
MDGRAGAGAGGTGSAGLGATTDPVLIDGGGGSGTGGLGPVFPDPSDFDTKLTNPPSIPTPTPRRAQSLSSHFSPHYLHLNPSPNPHPRSRPTSASPQTHLGAISDSSRRCLGDDIL